MGLIGQMRHRVTIQPLTVSRGELGAQVDTYATGGRTVWAAVNYKTAGSDERQAGKQVVARTRIEVIVRRESGPVRTSDRLHFDGDVLQVDSVLRTGERLEYLLIECHQVGEQKVGS
ncbi:head-tail adaptor protein [Lewinella sp. JB7]|uniref:head-tail adaptor protein n=1 Tax=Lewinella sp. JB7 TaxID=2962887 RepID=UPI0020C95F61|nr:head-tail adaptor protein [Lewinella sp. JB7]MCP9237154.1 head-tail adaptor protein [Lewinella sp. JB7]